MCSECCLIGVGCSVKSGSDGGSSMVQLWYGIGAQGSRLVFSIKFGVLNGQCQMD